MKPVFNLQTTIHLVMVFLIPDFPDPDQIDTSNDSQVVVSQPFSDEDSDTDKPANRIDGK